MTDTESEPDLTVHIGDGHKGDPLRLANPVIAAAGTYGTGLEVQRDLDLSAIGALVTPAITRVAHRRRPTVSPRETAAGLFLAGPFPSLGLRSVLNRLMPLWEGWPLPVIASIPASDADECVEIAVALAGHAGIDAIELSFVTPEPWLDRDGGAQAFQRMCRRLSDAWPQPLIVKLPYGLTNTLALVEIAASSGVDAVSLGGGLPASIIDRGDARRPRLMAGRVVGPATHPFALAAVASVCAGTEMPIIAAGGITTGSDALDFLEAGARAVQVGSASLRDPTAPIRVAGELRRIVGGTEGASGSLIGTDRGGEASRQ